MKAAGRCWVTRIGTWIAAGKASNRFATAWMPPVEAPIATSPSGASAIAGPRITGSGIFKDASTDETVRQYFFNGTVRNWQVIVPQLGTVEGPFQIANLEYAGQHDGEVRFDMGLESAGALSFAAAA